MSRPSEHPYLDIILANAERVNQLEAENARLRDAGDKLARCVAIDVLSQLFGPSNIHTQFLTAALDRWNEARRV